MRNIRQGLLSANFLLLALICVLTGCEKTPEKVYQFAATDAVSCTVQYAVTGKGYTFDNSTSAKEMQKILLDLAEGSFTRGDKVTSAGVFLYTLNFYDASGNLLDSLKLRSDDEIIRDGYVYGMVGGCTALRADLDGWFGVEK